MPSNSQALGVEGQDALDFSRVLLDCLRCAVITLDHRQRITGINPAAAEMLHLESGASLGQTAAILPQALRQIIRSAIAEGTSVNEQPVTIRDARRGELALLVSTTPMRLPDGGISGAVMVIHDVSGAKKWEASMGALDRLHDVGTFSAGMAHEVKNAFVAVKTFVDLLLEQNPHADLAEIVRLELGRISSILGRMRKFSQPTAARFAPLRAHAVLDKSLRLIQHLLEDKDIKLNCTLEAAADEINGNAEQLEQAFINLLFNALEAMGRVGELSVATDLLPAGSKLPGSPQPATLPLLRIRIKDSGPGIPPKVLEHLFEPFFTTKTEGTGLGLVITRRIIQDHGGHISVASELGAGTTFTLILPTIVPDITAPSK